jgi:hypothetical protein
MATMNGTATESIAVKTPDDTASSTNAPVPKPQETRPWPERKKPTDNYAFALAFIGEAITHMARAGYAAHHEESRGGWRRCMGIYCWNVPALRGKQKRSDVAHRQGAGSSKSNAEADRLGKVAEEL